MSKPERLSLNNKGLKVYDEKGHVSAYSELSLIHNKGDFKPKNGKKLTYDRIKNALESHLFMEEKKNKDAKLIIVVVGDKQMS